MDENIPGYLEFRRRLGYQSDADVYALRSFKRHLAEFKIESITAIDSSVILEYTQRLLERKKPQTADRQLNTVSNFFLYLQRMDLCESNPLSDRLTFKKLSFIPYVFSDAETRRILESFATDATQCAFFKSYIGHLGRHCLYTIIAHCGLRISEACRLRLRDISLSECTIYIENTKFRKDRKIPVSKFVIREITNYLSARGLHERSSSSEYLFLSALGPHLSRGTVKSYFLAKTRELGMYRKPELRGDTVFGSPSPHSLRHAFAVRTIRRWQAMGLSIDTIADTLMTYMGHSEFSSTQVYLKALSTDPGAHNLSLPRENR